MWNPKGIEVDDDAHVYGNGMCRIMRIDIEVRDMLGKLHLSVYVRNILGIYVWTKWTHVFMNTCVDVLFQTQPLLVWFAFYSEMSSRYSYVALLLWSCFRRDKGNSWQSDTNICVLMPCHILALVLKSNLCAGFEVFSHSFSPDGWNNSFEEHNHRDWRICRWYCRWYWTVCVKPCIWGISEIRTLSRFFLKILTILRNAPRGADGVQEAKDLLLRVFSFKGWNDKNVLKSFVTHICWSHEMNEKVSGSRSKQDFIFINIVTLFRLQLIRVIFTLHMRMYMCMYMCMHMCMHMHMSARISTSSWYAQRDSRYMTMHMHVHIFTHMCTHNQPQAPMTESCMFWLFECSWFKWLTPATPFLRRKIIPVGRRLQWFKCILKFWLCFKQVSEAMLEHVCEYDDVIII